MKGHLRGEIFISLKIRGGVISANAANSGSSKLDECLYRWRKRARSYNMPTFAVRFAVQSLVHEAA
jgi:hypothetical protein